MVESNFPFLSITRIDPDPVPGSVHRPLGDGKLPTSTNPLRRMFKAVVSPSDPVPPKNWKTAAFAGTSTIVVPVPWRFMLLLKFETKISPTLSAPPVGNPGGTKATPYGFTSPLPGTVDIARTGSGRNGRPSSSAIKTAEQIRQEMTAAANTFNTPNLTTRVKNCEPVIRFIWAISRFIVAPFLRVRRSIETSADCFLGGTLPQTSNYSPTFEGVRLCRSYF